METEQLSLWKLTPAARLDDPRWIDTAPVRAAFALARTPAEARQLAARHDTEAQAKQVGNESDNLHSAFLDEKLYRVDPAVDDDRDRPDRGRLLEAQGFLAFR